MTIRALVVYVMIVSAGGFGPTAAGAESPTRVYRIGYLLSSPLSDEPSPSRAAFLDGLRALGYVEGRNLAIEYRSANWAHEFLPDLAAELVAAGVDVIVPVGEGAIRAAKETTGEIPIVMPFSGDPAGTGLVASLARPGGNITGLTLDVTPEIGGKMLQLLKEVAPAAANVTVLFNPKFATYADQLRAMQAAAKELNVKLQTMEERTPEEVEAALTSLSRQRPDALIVMADPPTSAYRQIIAEFATDNRIPMMSSMRLYVDAGGLMSYGPNLPDNFRRAAGYVDKILKGASPAELPVEQPTKFELVVNLKTARALGLTIPRSVLLRAEEVIR